MGRAREKVAANVLRKRNVGLCVCANEVRRLPQEPEFQGSEGFEDLGTRLGRATAVQHARGLAMAHAIFVVAPPEDSFAARLVERRIPAADGEAEVQR